MRLSTISGILLIVPLVIIVSVVALQPGYGSPLMVLGVSLTLLSWPTSFAFDIIGIMRDNHKWLAVITTFSSALFAMIAFSLITG